MNSTYKYRLIKTSWGISITITGQVIEVDNAYNLNKVEVVPSIYIAVDKLKLSDEEIQYIRTGIQIVGDKILGKRQDIIIELMEVSFAETDYQPEALTYAMAGWAAQEFGFEYTLPDAKFDKDTNQYVYEH